jgi:hypothetical protein
MPKFIVNVKEVHNLPVEIVAETPEQAKDIVCDMIANATLDFDVLEYSHTLPSLEWEVKKKKK